METRSHAERIKIELTERREELTKLLAALPTEELDWAPAAGMKTYRALLQEIGAMELVCLNYAKSQEQGDWEAAFASIGQSGNDIGAILRDMEAVRKQTLAYLDGCTEADMETPIPLHGPWQHYFGGTHVEPEEIFRWICRHEYYHLGQLVVYRWQQGFEPAGPMG